MTTHSIARAISALALVVTVVATIVGAAISPDGSTEQGTMFVVAGVSALVGIAAGLAAALRAPAGERGPGFRWTTANVVVGLACVVIAIAQSIGNMN